MNTISSDNFDHERSLTHQKSISHRIQTLLHHSKTLLLTHVFGLQSVQNTWD